MRLFVILYLLIVTSFTAANYAFAVRKSSARGSVLHCVPNEKFTLIRDKCEHLFPDNLLNPTYNQASLSCLRNGLQTQYQANNDKTMYGCYLESHSSKVQVVAHGDADLKKIETGLAHVTGRSFKEDHSPVTSAIIFAVRCSASMSRCNAIDDQTQCESQKVGETPICSWTHNTNSGWQNDDKGWYSVLNPTE